MKDKNKIKENCKKIREFQDKNILLEFGLDTFKDRVLKTKRDEIHNLFTKETMAVINLWGYRIKKDGTLKNEPNRIYDPADVVEIIKLDSKNFDTENFDNHKKYMEENDISSMVFGDLEHQLGNDGEVYYLDRYDEEKEKFVLIVEDDDWERFKQKVEGLED